MRNCMLIVFVISVCRTVTAEDSKVDVGVYFESLCPDSYKFVKDQLQPSFKELAPYVNLKLVPFGKSASAENGTKFNCHHGPPECKGNKIISCALNRIPDQITQVEYTTCFMTIFRVERSNEEEYGQKCAQSVGVDIEGIKKCYNSEEGTNSQLTAEKDTISVLNAPLKSVPTIIFNGEFNQELHLKSLEDFKSVVCALAQKSNPQACKEDSSSVVPL